VESRVVLRILLALLVCCSSLICCRDDTSPPAETASQPVPPVELLRSNWDACTHLALVEVKEVDVADSIFADDGSLGYLIYRISGKLLRGLKGDFIGAIDLVYYNFLEYSPDRRDTDLDTVLVFLNSDPETGRFMAIEVGQFDYSDSLGRVIRLIGDLQ
jgi:hypothetical protein